MIDDIMVTVVCITYNHEEYITDAIEGFLHQKVNFKYEIVIHDDASTDQTAKIVKRYEEQYPEIIFGIYQEENQYSKKKMAFMEAVYSLCRGHYIAFCEGDDFWLDTFKLQKQVDWMERHREYILTAHNAVLWNCQDGIIKAMNPYSFDKEIGAEELIMQYNGNLPTASMMVRAEIIKELKNFQINSVGDIIIQFCCLAKGKIYYFHRIMSVYRYLHTHSWSLDCYRNNEYHILHCVEMIEFLKEYNKFTESKYMHYLVSKIHFYIQCILNVGLDCFYEVYEKQDFSKKNSVLCNLKEIKRVFLQIFDETYLDIDLDKFIQRHKRLVIFGAGDYASRVAKQLDNNQINFAGFAVSDLADGEKEYLGKPVWELKDISSRQKETGIIVAINPVIWNQLFDTLKANGITEYICPFLFKRVDEYV